MSESPSNGTPPETQQLLERARRISKQYSHHRRDKREQQKFRDDRRIQGSLRRSGKQGRELEMSLASAGNFVRFGLTPPLFTALLATRALEGTSRLYGKCEAPMLLR